MGFALSTIKLVITGKYLRFAKGFYALVDVGGLEAIPRYLQLNRRVAIEITRLVFALLADGCGFELAIKEVDQVALVEFLKASPENLGQIRVRLSAIIVRKFPVFGVPRLIDVLVEVVDEVIEQF